jgi:SARP family transcriptional regulator, regulator of embCAB operon
VDAPRLRILGPVSLVDTCGKRRDLSALKLRALLGYLLAERGRVVPVERLMELLWGASPPRTARTALHVYISNARKILDKACLVPQVANLVTEGDGYAMTVEASELDLSRFERRVAEARQAEDRGELEQAAGMLGEALTMWRGPALSDVRISPTMETMARRLDEKRIAAQLRLVRINIELGRDEDVIGDLYMLIAENPHNEKLCEYLMRALHNQGRPADALQVYSTFRAGLRENLGLEPGQAIQEFQHVVLSREMVGYRR